MSLGFNRSDRTYFTDEVDDIIEDEYGSMHSRKVYKGPDREEICWAVYLTLTNFNRERGNFIFDCLSFGSYEVEKFLSKYCSLPS